MTAWPGTIPHQPLNENYEHRFGAPLARAEMEQGGAKQRRIYSSAPMQLAMSFPFTPAQFEIFRTFHDLTLKHGTDAFDLSVFTGSAYETLSVNFLHGSLEQKRAGKEWHVSATLETSELPVMSSGALDALIGGAGAGLPAWPAAYIKPEPLNRDLDIEFPDGAARSDFEDGYLVQTRRFHAAPSTYRCTVPMTNAQYDAFRAFRVHRLGRGEKWFTMSIFRGGSYETKTVRIAKGSLSAKRAGDDWLMRAALEMRDLRAAA